MLSNGYAILYVLFAVYLISRKKAQEGLGMVKESTCWKFLVKIFIGKKNLREKKERSDSLSISSFKSNELDTFYHKLEDQNLKETKTIK